MQIKIRSQPGVLMKLSEMNPKATAEILPIAQQIGMQTMQELMQKAQEKGYLKQQ